VEGKKLWRPVLNWINRFVYVVAIFKIAGVEFNLGYVLELGRLIEL